MVRNSRSALKSAQKSFELQNSRNAVGTLGQYKDTASGSASSELQISGECSQELTSACSIFISGAARGVCGLTLSNWL